MQGARSKSIAELTRIWDQQADSGITFDQTENTVQPGGYPRIFVPRYKCMFHDDFMGLIIDTTNKWKLRDTSAAGTPSQSILDAANGVWSGILSSTSEVSVYGLDWNNLLFCDPAKGCVVEVGFTAGTTITTAETMYVGLSSAHSDTYLSIATRAHFKLTASMVVNCNADNATTDTGDVTSGVTAVAGTMQHGKIECVSTALTHFTLGGARVAKSTTFATGTGKLQFQAILVKSTGTTVPEIRLDYVTIHQRR